MNCYTLGSPPRTVRVAEGMGLTASSFIAAALTGKSHCENICNHPSLYREEQSDEYPS